MSDPLNQTTIRIYSVKDGFVVSEDEVWLPGCFETEALAALAVQYPSADLQRLQDAANERAGGQGGIITVKDLDGLEASRNG